MFVVDCLFKVQTEEESLDNKGKLIFMCEEDDQVNLHSIKFYKVSKVARAYRRVDRF